MDFGFLSKFSLSGVQSNENVASTAVSSHAIVKKIFPFDIKFFGWSLFSFAPWAVYTKAKIQMPTTVNKDLKEHAQPHSNVQYVGRYSAIRFRPYVSKVPWHTGARAFLSQFFPRYGHYCGPNWSSGKDRGSPVWDQRPIDWLDFCCYCHDIGYDTHNQAELLKADLAFLECLESPHMNTMGDPKIAYLYRTMCISGLRTILIPYRQNLLRLRAGQLLIDFRWLRDLKLKGRNLHKDIRVDLSLVPKGRLGNIKWKAWNMQKM